MTSRLGFGTARLLGGTWARESRSLLDAAFAAGITHFDTAKIYGDGDAESLLGEFLRCHAGDVTVATKYGLLPPPSESASARLFSMARRAARPIVRAVPALRSGAGRVAGAVGPQPLKANFTRSEAEWSLRSSLEALKTERVDLWLMHGATADDLGDPGLLEFAEEMVDRQTIGAFGVGNEAADVADLMRKHPRFCRVLQYKWSIGEPEAEHAGFRLHHGAIGSASEEVRAALQADPAKRKHWSLETDADLADPSILASLLLRSSLDANPDSIIIFTTRHVDRIERNVAVSEDESLRQPAFRLRELITHRGTEIP